MVGFAYKFAHGLVFRILTQAEDQSAIQIGFGNRNQLDEELYASFLSDYFNIFRTVYLSQALK